MLVLACAFFVVVVLVASGAAHGASIRGEAVYYSNSYKGSTMACGGTYRPHKMIAAHRGLPCGTRLRVRNVANGKTVTVTVADRGPYGDRSTILDLSRRAARRLGYVRAGRARVSALIVGG